MFRITDEQIEELRSEAAEAGDMAQVAICDLIVERAIYMVCLLPSCARGTNEKRTTYRNKGRDSCSTHSFVLCPQRAPTAEAMRTSTLGFASADES